MLLLPVTTSRSEGRASRLVWWNRIFGTDFPTGIPLTLSDPSTEDFSGFKADIKFYHEKRIPSRINRQLFSCIQVNKIKLKFVLLCFDDTC